VTSASAVFDRYETGGARDAGALDGLWDYVCGSGLRALVLGPSKDPNAKVTVLLVPPETSRPRLAIKVPTTTEAGRAIDAETRVLRELERLPLGELRRSIPRVVDLVGFEGRTSVVLAAVPGTPMLTTYLRWRHTRSAERVAADFAAASAWIADWQRATAGAPAPVEMDGGVASRLRDRFIREPELGADLETLIEICERLRRNTAPRTVVHGDFWFGNVLLEAGRVSGVVDWEAGSTSGEPLRDLVRFGLAYALYLDGRTRCGHRVGGHPGLVADSWGAGVAYALDGRGWFPDLFREFLRDGLARLGASPESWRDAALAGIAEVAALTDDDAFARAHLALFRRLSRTEGAWSH
jgi:hypothetical protein